MRKKKKNSLKITCITTNETTNVEKLQVILRPGPSTIGKSNQQRLFLRIQESFSDVCLDRLSLKDQQLGRGQDSNFDVVEKSSKKKENIGFYTRRRSRFCSHTTKKKNMNLTRDGNSVHWMATTKVASSGSAFPELLRRSRFASFDPTICQSYGTPPSHLHRGNWGLKRPIAQRKRNAFISLKNFEEHEHYIEWNNTESQVRMINRVEELNVAPKLVPHVPWYVGLGPAASSPWSMMDSEFSSPKCGMPLPRKSIPTFTTDLIGLGLRGKGQYGRKSTIDSPSSHDGYLHPNLHAMPPRVFNRYLKKLRSLRPEFQKFLKENQVSTSIRESGVPSGNLHIRFLGQHFEKQFQDNRNETDTDVHPNQPQSIRQQPHRLGGLMYASPTYLESYFTTGIQPAIVLESGSQQQPRFSNFNNSEDSFLISAAGFVGRLEGKKAGPEPTPAFSANSGGIVYPPAKLLAGQTSGNTFIKVRVVGLQLERLPAAVTAFPSSNSSRDVNIRTELAIHPSPDDFSRTNSYPPGSMQYNASDDYNQQPSRTHSFLSNNLAKGMYVRKHQFELSQHDTPTLGKFQDGSTMKRLQLLAHGSEQTSPTLGMKWTRNKNRNWQDDDWVEGSKGDGSKGDGSA